MKKIKLNVAVSLDGLIEGPNGEYDWCFTDQDYGMTEFLDSIDTILFGRKSYELLIKDFSDYYPDKTKYVFSRTILNFPNATVISDNIVERIYQIKNQPGKDIFLFGGADIVRQLMDADLIDEMHLSVHPVVLGKGKPLFSGLNERKALKLSDSIKYSSGLVQLVYKK